MNDVIGSAQSLDCFRTQHSMRVGDNADQDWLLIRQR
jgi:hypothetical protein